MSFDIEPDGDPHGECAVEIHSLQEEIKNLKQLLSISEGQTADESGVLALVAEERDGLIQALDLSIEGLGCTADLIHFLPPTHVFTKGSEAEKLQDAAWMLIQTHEELYHTLLKIRGDL